MYVQYANTILSNEQIHELKTKVCTQFFCTSIVQNMSWSQFVLHSIMYKKAYILYAPYNLCDTIIIQCTCSWIFAPLSFCPCSVDFIFDCAHRCAHNMQYTICARVHLRWYCAQARQGSALYLHLDLSATADFSYPHCPSPGRQSFHMMIMIMMMQPPQYALALWEMRLLTMWNIYYN